MLSILQNDRHNATKIPIFKRKMSMSYFPLLRSSGTAVEYYVNPPIAMRIIHDKVIKA